MNRFGIGRILDFIGFIIHNHAAGVISQHDVLQQKTERRTALNFTQRFSKSSAD